MKGACGGRGGGNPITDHRVASRFLLTRHESLKVVVIGLSGNFEIPTVSVHRLWGSAVYITGLICSIFVSANSTRSFRSCSNLRVKSCENVANLAIVSCCHVLTGLCEVVLRYALKLQVWNMYRTQLARYETVSGSALAARRLRYVPACRWVSPDI